MKYRNLTQEEHNQLSTFASERGRTWKSQLINKHWRCGTVMLFGKSWPRLLALRDSHGEQWLRNFKVQKYQW